MGILDSKIHILTSQCYKETLTALTLLLITDKRGVNGEVGNCDAGDGINFRINTKGENLLIYRIWQYFHFIAIVVVPMWFSVTILSSELISFSLKNTSALGLGSVTLDTNYRRKVGNEK